MHSSFLEIERKLIKCTSFIQQQQQQQFIQVYAVQDQSRNLNLFKLHAQDCCVRFNFHKALINFSKEIH